MKTQNLMCLRCHIQVLNSVVLSIYILLTSVFRAGCLQCREENPAVGLGAKCRRQQHLLWVIENRDVLISHLLGYVSL